MVHRLSAIWFSLLAISLIFYLFSCNDSTQDQVNEIKVDLGDYQMADGFRLEAVAAEPQVIAPVTIVFDDRSRIWVVEMVGYMTDFPGSKEDLPNGRISILEDHDKNGVVDHKKIFLDGLVMPRALSFTNGGLLYATPPELWWVPINADDSPGEAVLVDSTYAVGGNVEHQPNGLKYNVDNWIYSANSNVRYRYRNQKWEKEFIFRRGQWGITHDDYGRLYVNDNSNQFRGDYFLPGILDQNKNLANPPGVSVTIVSDQRVYPLQFTAVNRGYMKGILDSVSHKLRNFTSAAGPLYYTGGQYDGEFENNSFVGGPEVNLVKRNRIDPSQVKTTGKQYYKNSEFLISSDKAFRPVTLTQGPDGWIYIVDMHRGIIQHKTYLTNYLRGMYVQEGLDTIDDMGRILRILPEGLNSGEIPTVHFEEKNLIDLLQHPNSWQRITAQQHIVENQMKGLIPDLKQLLDKDDVARYVPIHAFWTLEGLQGLNEETVLHFAVRDDGYYYPHAIKYLTTYHPEWIIDLSQRLKESNFQFSERNSIYRAVSTRYISDQGKERAQYLTGILDELSPEYRPFALYMALSQFTDKEDELLFPLKKASFRDKDIISLINKAEEKIEHNKSFYALKKDTPGKSRDSGLEIFETNCSTCHGRDGKGTENLAPPLFQSPYLEDNDSALVMIVLHGLQGPVEIGGKVYEFSGVMPALVDNTEYTDQEIASVLSFVKNAFGKPRSVPSELVKKLREYPSKDGDPYTVQSLEARLEGIDKAEN